jgi:hypothetical protein
VFASAGGRQLRASVHAQRNAFIGRERIPPT